MSAKCPNCGFSYAWDGTVCEHCHFPDCKVADPDEWAASRILWIARQYHLPQDRPHFLAELNDNLRAEFEELLDQGAALGVGKPVIALVKFSSQWTLLGTRKVVSLHGGEVHEAGIDQLTAMRPSLEPRSDSARRGVCHYWKGVPWEYLQLTDRHGRHVVVWVPAGNEAFAVLKILESFSPEADFAGTVS